MTGTEAALASLRLWSIEVELGGELFRVPAKPANEWFLAVLSNEVWPIVPGLCEPADEERLFDLVLDGRATDADVERANRDALASASGWRWWEAERLIVSAAVEWKVIGGLLLATGIDVERASLGAVLATMYALAVTNMAKEERIAFDSKLGAPPIGYVDANPEEWFASTGAAESFAELIRSASTGG